MKIAFLSDTHMAHRRIDVPRVDLLVHAGDITRRGTKDELDDFLEWLARQHATTKVFVAGNHDRICERQPSYVRSRAAELGLVYLEDETVEIDGLVVHGSPATPAFRSMAFNRERGADIRRTWERVPPEVDLLITHGPPKGLGDRTFFGAHVGCEELRARLAHVRPRLHVFGHIHEAFGEHRLEGHGTRFLNVASRGLLPGSLRPPVLVELAPT